jgi:superfamily I DNA/RNA helicase
MLNARTFPSKFFQLTVNYRSHAAIVACASVIIKVLSTVWPTSIDILQEECGIGSGNIPILFNGLADDIYHDQFLFTSQ